ncbi:uncharacterized protein CC84DRAFT_1221430 [Paraphaeosphaeria sporulosa]|uniref:Cora-domain-containing protein n=1 Tax=Paraphaeosphaeria sporulosa TaxID=1460663 RepID=A0A177C1V4_9PLEO|nr:uncharacterized protein CC84DRAFT_1221430 [Paraphaeosphaeria sporulosa]OAG00869.1 hypothetical protein CC84DRAFT_1221430 [Paraphaeosphaeria sporulosa]
MERRRFLKLLEHPGTFRGADHLSCAEVETSEASTGSSVRKGRLAEKDVAQWLNKDPIPAKDNASSYKLRVLACTSITKSDHRPSLALSRTTYELLADRWSLPHSLLYVLSTRTSCFVPFEDIENRTTGHVFQTIDKNGRPFTCALTHSPHTSETNVLLFGLLPDEFEIICDELSTPPQLFACPTFIPICLIDMVNEIIEHDLESGRIRTHNIMLELGMRKSSTEGVYVDCSLHHCDFVPITRALTGLTANLAKCELACEAHSLLLGQMDKELDAWLNSLDAEYRRKIDRAAMMLRKRSDNLREWMQAMKPRTKYLTQRSQAYVQTVYSLMAQKDNALNMQTAEASLNLSRASFRDSAAMIAIAEDSKQVALATSKDSSSMFIISALTLAFLPPTYTATLFSTQFFDLNSKTADNMTSSRFWLYWAVTVPLTMITTACARVFYYLRDKRMREKLCLARQDSQLTKIEKGPRKGSDISSK